LQNLANPTLIYFSPSTIQVDAGKHFLSGPANQSSTVSQVIIHGSYDR